ncbi:hypothetical protein DCC81_17650 [Chitinophaga parva]|uniref:Uncharacterized protein n=1 Tax=Chitinophaga parva TaxID=2169414 RepID=A0A2T7BIF4_9BACT|nr:hypothetical protein DCC81_17650 [Chitinophaga parva]
MLPNAILPAFPRKPAPAATSLERLPVPYYPAAISPETTAIMLYHTILAMNVLSRGIRLAPALIPGPALQTQNCTVNAGSNTSACSGTTGNITIVVKVTE